MKTQIGLGVLSIPVAFDALGVVPGVIVLIAIAAITTWSDYIIGVFKLRHREVYGIDDVGELLLGKTGRIVLGTAFCLCKFSFHLGMPGISSSLSLAFCFYSFFYLFCTYSGGLSHSPWLMH